MLESLRISGLALLRDCELELAPGLTVISGETGAGKTVLLTSLRLLMGGRAEPSMVAELAPRTEVDAVAILSEQLAKELDEAGYATEDHETVFSRTVAKEGRSRGAIAGRPVPAKTLADTVGQMVTIHGQADQWRLRGSGAQRDLLDNYAGPKHADLLEAYGRVWQQTTALRDRYQSLTANHDQLVVELDYLRGALTQIDDLAPNPGDEEEIDAGIDRLTNVEQLRSSVGGALDVLDSDQALGLVESLGRVCDALRKASRLDPSVEALALRASELEVEAGALTSDLRDYVDGLFDDPGELARLHDRRARLTELMRGRATTVPELLSWAAKARSRVGELEGASSDPDAALRALKESETQLHAASAKLSESRRRSGKQLAERVDLELKDLALKEASFVVQIEPQELGTFGGDRVTMSLKPHPSAPLRPISQGASGGELSRIMLALEVSLAERDQGKTFVFDEIDAGIGGTTAGTVALRLRQLADSQQVIVVTHQPQIAVMADANFVVSKNDGLATVTAVSGTRRTDEIVRMLGGEGDAARRLALDLERRARARINQ